MIISENRVKSLLALIVVLLMSNIALIYLLQNKKSTNGRKREHGLALYNYLKDDLGFSKAQLTTLDSIRGLHQAAVKHKFDSIGNAKQIMYKSVGIAAFTDSAIESAAYSCAMQQKETETVMLKHLKEIREICTPQQRAKFDTGFYKVFRKFGR